MEPKTEENKERNKETKAICSEETTLAQHVIDLLYELKELVWLAQLVEYLVDAEDCEHVSVGLGQLHYVSPVLVHRHEPAPFFRHLRHDVWWAEDRLEVQPRRLHLQPLVHDVLQRHQIPLPVSASQTRPTCDTSVKDTTPSVTVAE